MTVVATPPTRRAPVAGSAEPRPARGGAAERRRRIAGSVALSALALAAALYPFAASDYTEQVAYRVFIYAALAQAWNLIAGYGGLVSLGSAAFIGVGSYTTAEITNHSGTPLLLALLASGLLAAVLAVLLSPALFRLRGVYFTVASLAMAEALRILMVNTSVFGGAAGIFLLSDAPTTRDLYYYALGIAVVSGIGVTVLLRTRLALALRAVRDDEDVAGEMGVVTFRTKLIAFAISATIMGAVGALQAEKLGEIEPYGAFGLQWTIDIVTVAIIGGIATRFGPFLGAVATVFLAEFLSAYPELHVAITGAIVIVLIRFAPRGLWGTATERLPRWGAWAWDRLPVRRPAS